jgi:hypothetical protein
MSRPPTVSNSFKSRQIEVSDQLILGSGIKVTNATSTLPISGNTNTLGSILSGGVNLLSIFSTGPAASGIQNLSFNQSNYNLSISDGNTVNLSALVVTTNIAAVSSQLVTTISGVSSQINSNIATLTASLPATFSSYLSTNSVIISALNVTTGLTAQSSNIPVTIVDLTGSRTFTDSDTNKVFHFNTTSSSLCAIVPNALPSGFNIAIMNTGTNSLVVSAGNLRSTGTTIIDQFGGAYIYKQNNTIFAVGRLY